jgi:hypothetical protein
LYIPIGSELTYSVEYRLAVGSDLNLASTQIFIPGSNMYYPGTPSHGLQLRILRTYGTRFKDLQPTLTNFKSLETALVIPSFTGDQLQPLGKVFNLSDGSTLTFVSADPNTGATVRIQRSVDKDPPIVSEILPRWVSKQWIDGYYGRGNIFKNDQNQWEYPTAEIPLDTITDNRLVKTVQVEINVKSSDKLINQCSMALRHTHLNQLSPIPLTSD